MSADAFDILGIGNAIVDVLAHAEESFLSDNGIQKSGMTLIDEERAHTLYDLMGPAVEISGGSAANTAAGVASLGGRAAFVGKVKNDQLGEVFRHDIRATGVTFNTALAEGGPSTARCFILVTPDAHRSMNTYLGACTELTSEDIVPAEIAAAHITYMEGYLFDPPEAKKAFYKAAELAHEAGRKVSLTLSDSFCVDRYREEFRHLIETQIDILIANEAEILSLFQTEHFDDALQAIRPMVEMAALTRSEHGSVIVSGEEMHVVEAAPVAELVDTTGAGDLYAAGFLYGVARGLPLGEAGRLGSLAAAEVIGHIGARPEVSLKALAEKDGLL